MIISALESGQKLEGLVPALSMSKLRALLVAALVTAVHIIESSFREFHRERNFALVVLS